MLEARGERDHPTIEGAMKYEYIHRYILSLQFVGGKDVLNIAAGGGYGSRILAQVAASVIGIDYDKDAVEQARRASAAIGNLKFVQGSYDAIPLGDQSIDVVVSFETFEHYVKYDELLTEIKRVLRPNGLLVLSTVNKSIIPGSSSTTYHEWTQLIDRHFSNVTVYAQRSNIASFIYPFDIDHHEIRFHYAPAFERNDLSKNVQDVAVYFFITASDDTLPTPDRVMSVHSDLTASPDGYALYTLMAELAQLYADLDTSRRTLASMRGSKFWKLRDAWFGVRNRRAWVAAVAPPHRNVLWRIMFNKVFPSLQNALWRITFNKVLWPLTFNHRAIKYPIPGMKLIMAAVVPPILKILFRRTYNSATDIATKFSTPQVMFMNLGYSGGADEPGPALEVIDEPDRLRIQLYHHVGTLVDLTGREVLEVGCGRGGGASYVKRYLGPSSMVGMDLADNAVEFCRRVHRLDGLRFVQGDAERMPFEDQQFDVVINVESSHCYPTLDAFFREVKRVLRPCGHFLYADVMLRERLLERRRMLGQAGLEIVQEHDITSNVLASLDSDTDQRVAFVETLAPVLGLDAAREWMMVPGAQTLDRLRVGTLCYVSMAVRAG